MDQTGIPKSRSSKASLLYVSAGLLVVLVAAGALPVTTYQVSREAASEIFPPILNRTRLRPDYFYCCPSIRNAEKRFEVTSTRGRVPPERTPGFVAIVRAGGKFDFRYKNIIGSVPRPDEIKSDDEFTSVCIEAVLSLIELAEAGPEFAVRRPRFAYYWDRKIHPQLKDWQRDLRRMVK